MHMCEGAPADVLRSWQFRDRSTTLAGCPSSVVSVAGIEEHRRMCCQAAPSTSHSTSCSTDGVASLPLAPTALLLRNSGPARREPKTQQSSSSSPEAVLQLNKLDVSALAVVDLLTTKLLISQSALLERYPLQCVRLHHLTGQVD